MKRLEGRIALITGAASGIFRVDPKTVTRWANSGKLTTLRTPGGHRRYKESEVRDLLGGSVSAIATWGAMSTRWLQPRNRSSTSVSQGLEAGT